MRRKQYKIKWDESFTLPQIDCDAYLPDGYPAPDFVFREVRYWFDSMRSSGEKSLYLYLMDECPRTGAIMWSNAAKGQWYIQPQEVQKAYENWLVDKHFTS